MRSISKRSVWRLASVSTGALAVALSLATTVAAQTTTSNIRGQAAPDSEVVARNVENGFTTRAQAGTDGRYSLSGLEPGSYQITGTNEGGEAVSETVSIGIGQTAELDLSTPEDAGTLSAVVVTGERSRPLQEVRTSEVGTNVSQAQIDDLPQGNRNFLNLAGLVPGIRTSTDEFRQGISAGANGAAAESLGSSQTNVFIDGVSLKSNVQQGGLVGQDASRGNPFSQLAVQEFRVLTSNFKAEYEQAGTALITAITRSGGNKFRGEAFVLYQDDSFVSKNFFQDRDNREVPDLSRKQYGFSLGGPIIRDRLQFFAAYEVNDQVRNNTVIAGGTAATRALIPFDVTEFEGVFDSPFRSDLTFGKLTFRINDQQTFEVGGSYREETDIRGFGGTTAREAGELIFNNVTTVRFRHNYDSDRFLNELSYDYRDNTFRPTGDNPDLIGRTYAGVIRVGGRSTSQDVSETNHTLRNNLTFDDIEFRGRHIVKMGGKISFQSYNVSGGNFTNPLFTFTNNPAQRLDFSLPTMAQFGIGTPNITADNTQIGIFIQDDWNVNEHLGFNLGIRYDYETNANNNDYVTPDNAVRALRSLENTLSRQPGNFFDADDYISTGDNREPFKYAIQPRIGFSYDFNADQRTVVFGGYGRFYDRTLFRNAAEETLLRQFALRTYLFSRDGLPRAGAATILFRPEYLSKEGLEGLIASGLAPDRELRVVKNDQEPPYTDQFSVGLRKRFLIRGTRFNTSATLTHQIGKNEIAYFPANRNVEPAANGDNVTIVVPEFNNVIASTDLRETRYTAIFLFAEKPFTAESRFGATLAATFTQAEAKGFAFNFDRPNVAAAPFVPNGADEEVRIVGTTIIRLPFDFRLSGTMTYGSGQPFQVVDQRTGFGRFLTIGNFEVGDNFKSLDLRLTKRIDLPGQTGNVELIGEVFNATNAENFRGFDNFIGVNGNPNFGNPNAVGSPRQFQVGLRYRY